MMLSRVLAISDEIVAALNAYEFSQDFTAERIYQLPKDSENADLRHYETLRVVVVPAGVRTALAARDTTEDECVITVGVLKRAEDPAALDALVALTGEIADWFRFRHIELPDGANVQWVGAGIDPLFAPEALNERRQFVSVIAVTYRQLVGV